MKTTDQHPGTCQQDRNSLELQAENVSADGRTDMQLLRSVQQQAKKMYFEQFLPDNEEQLKALIAYGKNPQEHILTDAGLEPFLQPHQQLLMVFLELMQHPRRQFDQLIRKHQGFYYRQVLGFSPDLAVAHKAHVKVTLADGIDSHLLKKGVLFDGGKDKAGNTRQYALSADTVINRSKLDEVRIHETGKSPVTYLYQRKEDKELTPFSLGLTNVRDRKQRWSEVIIVTSPILFLAEGKRYIILKFYNENFNNALQKNYRLHISTEKGWQSIPEEIWELNDQLTINLPSDFPAISILPTFKGKKSVSYPMIAITPIVADSLLVQEGRNGDLSCEIRVEVEGLRDIKIRNERQVLNNNNSYKPFDNSPKIGAKFYFAHKEICGKALTSLTLRPIWVPGAVKNKDDYPDIEAIYQNYHLEGNVCKSRECLKVNLDLFGLRQIDNVWNSPLFCELKFPKKTSLLSFTKSYYPILTNDESLSNDPLKWPLTFQMEFTEGDFGYNQYIHELNREAQELASENISKACEIIDKKNTGTSADVDKTADIEKKEPKVRGVIHTPYNPELRGLIIDYSATDANYNVDQPDVINSEYNRIYLTSPTDFLDYLPDLTEQNIPEKGEGDKQSSVNIELLLKISPCPTGRTFNLWFEMEELTSIRLGEIDIDTLNQLIHLPPADISWSYLPQPSLLIPEPTSSWPDDPEKEEFNVHIPSWEHLVVSQDGTGSLQKTGLIVFKSPSGSEEHASEFWVKASIKSASPMAKILNISGQGVEVIYQPQPVDDASGDDSSDQLHQLEINQITSMVEPDQAIKTIQQSSPSFGGQAQETVQEMNIRISERLRHRQRAFSIFDYELLVLQKFPEIAVVKCITTNHIRSVKRGTVQLLVIPRANIQPSEKLPLIPMATTTLCRRVEQYIRGFCSGRINIEVQNPYYKELVCNIDVEFKADVKDVSYELKLQQDLTKLICPWAYHADKTPVLGQRISEMALTNYLIQKPYIESINTLEIENVEESRSDSNCSVQAGTFFLSSTQHKINKE